MTGKTETLSNHGDDNNADITATNENASHFQIDLKQDDQEATTVRETGGSIISHPLTVGYAGEVNANTIQDVEAVEQTLEKVPTTASEKPFSSFSLWEKRMIIGVASVGGFLSPLTTNIYFPALNTIAADLGVSITKLNLTITTYMIFQGVAPSFIGTFADNQGRRPAYIVGYIIYIASNIALGVNKSYAGLMVLRCVQSCGSSGMVTLMAAVVADVITSAERGSYIAFTNVGTILGPSVSPIIGGLLSQHLGWHSIFWFLVIFSGIFATLMISFYPETCRGIVSDGSVPPPKWNKSLISIHKERRQRKRDETLGMSHEIIVEKNAKQKFRFPNPMAVVRVCAEKETAVILLFGGLLYACYYALTTTLTTQFHAIYHLNDTDLGLIFLTLAGGSICAAFTNGQLLDRNYRRHAKKAGLPLQRTKQMDMSNFNIERVRLEIGLPFLSAGACFTIVYGWLLEYEVHIAGPLVTLTFLGYCTLAGFNTLTVLIIDTHRSNPATASAAGNLVRCLLGAVSSAVANPMINAMGRGWTFTLIGLVELALMPLLLAVMKWGPEWRRADKQKLEEQQKRRAEQNAANDVR